MPIQKLPKVPIIEIFGPTIQGEGLMTGTVTHFIRTGGCGLRCTWCDSMYAVDPAQIKANRTMMTIPDITKFIHSLAPAPYVTLTGGDPCIHKHLGGLIMQLNVAGMRVAVETQGQLFPSWLGNCDVVTLSPKGPSSGNVVDVEPIFKWLRNAQHKRTCRVCIKVVVFDAEDFEYAMDVYDGIPKQMYDSFYVTAGTPMDTEDLPARVEAVLENERALTQMVLMATQVGRQFHDRFHVGCQQHVLLWPNEDKGV